MRASRKTVDRARALRRALSPPEVLLWSRLRERAPGKPVFRRQHLIGPYVLDFYCAKARLAIELDGMSHDMGDRPRRDLRRDAWLQARGITVLRIPVVDLTRGIDEVADAIVAWRRICFKAEYPLHRPPGGPPPPLRGGRMKTVSPECWLRVPKPQVFSRSHTRMLRPSRPSVKFFASAEVMVNVSPSSL
jgi:very-short-patch-repair endonuclease